MESRDCSFDTNSKFIVVKNAQPFKCGLKIAVVVGGNLKLCEVKEMRFFFLAERAQFSFVEGLGNE